MIAIAQASVNVKREVNAGMKTLSENKGPKADQILTLIHRFFVLCNEWDAYTPLISGPLISASVGR